MTRKSVLWGGCCAHGASLAHITTSTPYRREDCGVEVKQEILVGEAQWYKPAELHGDHCNCQAQEHRNVTCLVPECGLLVWMWMSQHMSYAVARYASKSLSPGNGRIFIATCIPESVGCLHTRSSLASPCGKNLSLMLSEGFPVALEVFQVLQTLVVGVSHPSLVNCF